MKSLDQDLRRRLFSDAMKKSSNFLSFDLQQNAQDYYDIYFNYLFNLSLSLVSYKGMPKTFNNFGFEYLLRYVGWAGITAIDKDHIYVSSMSGGMPSSNLSLGGLYGVLDSADSGNKMIKNLLSDKKIVSLNLQNMDQVEQGTPVRVTVANKPQGYAWMMNAQQMADVNLISKTAYALAYIKASILQLIGQMRTSWVGVTNNGSQTAKAIYEQLQAGQPLIQVDKGLIGDDDLSKVLRIFPAQVDGSKLAQLQDQWNNVMGDFLTQIGIDNITSDKKERLTAAEGTANDEQVSYGMDIYLKARQMGLDMINEALGTNLQATANDDSVNELINFAKTGTNTFTGESAGGTHDSESDDQTDGD